MNIDQLARSMDPANGVIAGGVMVRRSLSDLKGCFHDSGAFEAALKQENPLLYTVSSVEPASDQGDLHYGLGTLMPGRVGDEYYMTKGHLHSWREAAEVYVGLSGEGFMLLEDEGSGETRMVPLGKDKAVYVPGHTAHRTVNTGGAPLVYLGIYPAKAGHDYRAIAERNFRCVVVERNGKPVMLNRKELTAS